MGLSMIVGAHARDKAGREIPGSEGILRLVVAVWSYALLSGLAAFALIQLIAALVPAGGLRLSLQLPVIPAVAVAAGAACPRVLTTVNALFARPGR